MVKKEDVALIGTQFIAGAAGQAGAEALKVIMGSAPQKFPEGWQSFNSVEEILEGGIAAGMGAVAGKLVHAGLCRRKILRPSFEGEVRAMVIGSVVSYGTMAIVAGPIIHEITGCPDVKWGPFK